MRNTEIHYSIGQVAEEKRRHRQATALNAFRTSRCDHMSMGDLRYYAEQTGKSVEWLLEHAQWGDPLGMFGVFLTNAATDPDMDRVEALFLSR